MNPANKEFVSTVLESVNSVVTGLKYGGWALDELAALFSEADPGRDKPMTASKARQRVNNYRTTGGILWRADRVRVIAMHSFEAECRRAELDARMPDEEVAIREAMLAGKLDRPPAEPTGLVPREPCGVNGRR